MGRTSQPGKAVVRTLEICELGFSMLGKKGLPKKVFSALMRACLEDAMDVEDLPEAAPEEEEIEARRSEAMISSAVG